MRSVASALIVVAGGAIVSVVAARRAAETGGAPSTITDSVQRTVAAVRERVRRATGGSIDPVSEGGPRAGQASGQSAGAGSADRRPAGATGFVPALEGIRGLAAVGVLTTHVAFVTRSSTGSPIKRIFGRLDLAVAVFFAKSDSCCGDAPRVWPASSLPLAAR